jgi:hypothetical protein
LEPSPRLLVTEASADLLRDGVAVRHD